MSVQIRHCEYFKAFNEEEAFDILVNKAMQPEFEVVPCTCQPPCRMLSEEDKMTLQRRVNERVGELRIENAMKNGMSLEDLCGFVAEYLKARHGKEFTSQQVFNLSPSHNIAQYLDMYEEAVFNMRRDFFGRTALAYFEERVQTTMNDPALKQISARYQNAVAQLELIKLR